jgi:hypothetical protein
MTVVNPVRIGGAGQARSAAAPTAVPFRGVQDTQVRPADTAGAFQVIGQAVETLAGELERNMIRRDQLTAAQFQARFNRMAETEIAQLDPTAPDHDQQVQGVLSGLRDQLMDEAELNTNQVRERLQADLIVRSEGYRGYAAGQRREALATQAQEDLQGFINTFAAQVREDPAAVDLYRQELDQNAERLLSAIPPEAHDNIRREIDLQSVNAMVDGLSEEGRYQAAEEVIQSNAEILEPQQARALRRRIRATRSRRRQEFLRATAGHVAELEIALARASTEEELQQVEQRINDSTEQGIFNNREGTRATLIRRLEGRRQQVVQQEREYTNALVNLNSGGGVRSQDEADLLWEGRPDAGQPGMRGEIPENPATPLNSDQIDQIATFAADAGFVPTQVRTRLQAAERLNDPQILAQASALDQAIRNQIGPEVDTGAGNRVEQTTVRSEVLGVSREMAAEMVIQTSPLDQAQQQQRQEVFREEIGQEIDYEQVADELTVGAGIPGLFGVGDLDAANLSARARSDFAEAFEFFYTQSGDRAVAREQAIRRLRQNYGTSQTADGQTRLMRHAPERFLGRDQTAEARRTITEHAPDIIRRDIEDYLRNVGVDLFNLEQHSEGNLLPRYSLVADDQTEREVRRGDPPSYQIRVNNGTAMVPFVSIARGRGRQPARYIVPVTGDELAENPVYQDVVAREDERIVREQSMQQRIDREREAGGGDPRETLMDMAPPSSNTPPPDPPSFTNPLQQDFFPEGEGEQDTGLPPGFSD